MKSLTLASDVDTFDHVIETLSFRLLIIHPNKGWSNAALSYLKENAGKTGEIQETWSHVVHWPFECRLEC
jgi:hypothetical protein